MTSKRFNFEHWIHLFVFLIRNSTDNNISTTKKMHIHNANDRKLKHNWLDHSTFLAHIWMCLCLVVCYRNADIVSLSRIMLCTSRRLYVNIFLLYFMIIKVYENRSFRMCKINHYLLWLHQNERERRDANRTQFLEMHLKCPELSVAIVFMNMHSHQNSSKPKIPSFMVVHFLRFANHVNE